MTREQAIRRWADLACTFFWAEKAISKEWYPKLKDAHKLSKDEQHELALAYFLAIGKEIVSHLSDEELERLYKNVKDDEEEGGEK